MRIPFSQPWGFYPKCWGPVTNQKWQNNIHQIGKISSSNSSIQYYGWLLNLQTIARMGTAQLCTITATGTRACSGKASRRAGACSVWPAGTSTAASLSGARGRARASRWQYYCINNLSLESTNIKLLLENLLDFPLNLTTWASSDLPLTLTWP